jgi:peptidoglycan/LPS O-acetylase OafA/YrhL
VSYGLYLFHVPVLGSLQRLFPGLAAHPFGLFLPTSALSLAVAAVSHRYVEAPILALQERFRPARLPLSDATAPLPGPRRVGWVREG